MVADLAAASMFTPESPSAEAALAMIEARQPDFVSFPDWKKIDEAEVTKGQAEDRPRVKFTQVAEMLAVAKG
jgi:ferredoxin--NADP+ reductase